MGYHAAVRKVCRMGLCSQVQIHARVAGVFSRLLVSFAIREALYFFERKEPDRVRPELGRCAMPGFASFQVLTRTLRKTCRLAIRLLSQNGSRSLTSASYPHTPQHPSP